MRYWRLRDSDRVLAVNKEVQMTPRWEEISKEEYDTIRKDLK